MTDLELLAALVDQDEDRTPITPDLALVACCVRGAWYLCWELRGQLLALPNPYAAGSAAEN